MPRIVDRRKLAEFKSVRLEGKAARPSKAAKSRRRSEWLEDVSSPLVEGRLFAPLDRAGSWPGSHGVRAPLVVRALTFEPAAPTAETPESPQIAPQALAAAVPANASTLLEARGALARGEIRHFELVAEAEGAVTLRLGLQGGDADLFLRLGGAASAERFTRKVVLSELSPLELAIPLSAKARVGLALQAYRPSAFVLSISGPRGAEGSSESSPSSELSD